MKKKHNTSDSKVTPDPALVLARQRPLRAIFSSLSTLGGIEKLSGRPPGGGTLGAGPLRCAVTCDQASGTSSQRFWLRRHPAGSCRPHTTTFCPPALPRGCRKPSRDQAAQPADQHRRAPITDAPPTLTELNGGRVEFCHTPLSLGVFVRATKRIMEAA